MTISEIYKQYPVNIGLQEHMIRVASVAHYICNHTTESVDTKNIVNACLLHDMGNLIKAKLDPSSAVLLEPEGIEYWKQVQQETIVRYGIDEHEATFKMVQEINPCEQTILYLKAIGSESTKHVAEEGILGEKIANYSDMRVGLYGIITLKARMQDLRERYIGREKSGFLPEEINQREKLLQMMEPVIFEHTTITPSDITDESTRSLQEMLWTWEV